MDMESVYANVRNGYMLPLCILIEKIKKISIANTHDINLFINLHDMLYRAVQENDVDALTKLIDAGLNPGVRLSNRPSLLSYAMLTCISVHVAVLISKGKEKELLDLNDDIHIINGMPLLHQAVHSNNASMVRILIGYGVDTHSCDNEGRNALMYALQQKRNSDVVDALLEGEVCINQIDTYGNSILYHALQNCPDIRVFKKIVEKVENINCLTEYEDNVLMRYVSSGRLGQVSIDKIQMLLDKGLNINQCNDVQENVLFAMLFRRLADPKCVEMLAQILYLLNNNGLNFNQINIEGNNVLMYYLLNSYSPDPYVVGLLLSYGVDPSIQNKNGDSAQDIAKVTASKHHMDKYWERVKEMLEKHVANQDWQSLMHPSSTCEDYPF